MTKMTQAAAVALVLLGGAHQALAYTAPAGTLAPSAPLGSGPSAPATTSLSHPSGPLMGHSAPYQAPAGTLGPAAPLVSPKPAPMGSPMPSFPAPAPAPQSGVGFAVPTPNGFIAGGATAGGHGGIIQHEDHGAGYQTNGGTYSTPNGNGIGGSVTTGPNGAPVAGSVTGTKSFP